MTAETEKLIEEALKLPPEARAAIAGSLLDSLDEEVDEDAEAAWRQEISRRLSELAAGSVSLVDWSEARQRILRG